MRSTRCSFGGITSITRRRRWKLRPPLSGVAVIDLSRWPFARPRINAFRFTVGSLDGYATRPYESFASTTAPLRAVVFPLSSRLLPERRDLQRWVIVWRHLTTASPRSKHIVAPLLLWQLARWHTSSSFLPRERRDRIANSEYTINLVTAQRSSRRNVIKSASATSQTSRFRRRDCWRQRRCPSTRRCRRLVPLIATSYQFTVKHRWNVGKRPFATYVRYGRSLDPPYSPNDVGLLGCVTRMRRWCWISPILRRCRTNK